MKLSIIIYFLLFLLISGLLQVEVKAQSLSEYIKVGAENNPGLKAKYQQYLSALEKVPQVGALPDPSLSFGYFISPVETRVGPQRARFSVQQMLPWFGSLDAKSNAVQQEAKVRFEEFTQARNELYFKIKKSYYQLFDIEQEIRLTEENIEVLESLERLATQKYENDLTSMVDILRAQMKIRSERNKLLTLQENLQAQLSEFNTLLNRAPDAIVELPLSLEDPLTLADSSSLSERILANHPSLSVLAEENNLLSERERVAQLSGKPNLGVGLDYVVIGSRSDMEMVDNGKDALMPMVSLSIPLFNGRKYTAARKEVQLQQDANLLATKAQENELINTLNETLRDYQLAQNNVQLYEAQIESTQQAISILNSAYETTSENFEDVLEFQIQLLEYRIMLNEALTVARIAHAKLDELTAVEVLMNDE